MAIKGLLSCRDCSRCNELGIVSLLLGPFRLVWWILTFWNIGLFIRKCPECGHKMSLHSFRDE